MTCISCSISNKCSQITLKFSVNQVTGKVLVNKVLKLPFKMNKRKFNQLENKPSTSNETANITPISSLVFSLSLWTIRALIFAKSPFRQWQKNNKSGSVINFDVQDDSGKIRIVAYNKFAEEMNGVFNVGDVIQLSKGVFVPTNKLWCKLDHLITINISKYSVFEKLSNTCLNLNLKITFNTIEKILKMDVGHSVNFVAIVIMCRNNDIIRNSDKKEFFKKELLCFDSSCKKIVLTLWQQVAEKFLFQDNMIISVTNATVTNYYTKSLSADSLEINPQSEIAMKLVKWFNQNKNKITFPTFDTDTPEIILLNAITKQLIKQGNVFYICKATLIDFKDIIKYEACEKCLKKISEFNDEEFNCKFCKNVSFSCKNMFMVKVLIVDPSKQIWLTLFENQIRQLLNEKTVDFNMLSNSLELLKDKEFLFYIKTSLYLKDEDQVINFSCDRIVHL